jgi:CheY-like chemotaxis protein/HPt (histidine-containing phosphotransfer) domain-containing protein
VNLSEFLDEFQLEAGEKLDIIASQLLRLERDSGNPQPVREMFLAAHTIKGGAAMLRLTDVESLAHAIEDLLSSFRDQHRVLDGPTADLLFQSIDHLRSLVASASSESVGLEPDLRIASFAAQLRANADGSARTPIRGVVDDRPLNRRALLVDDSPTVRELYRMLLEDAGFEVEAVEDGRTALASALAADFALVVSSLQNAGMGGFELASELRANPTYRDVPIILTSADTDPDLARRATECGARALVRKGSLHEERLREVLREIGALRAS